jgi:ribosome-binding factor A
VPPNRRIDRINELLRSEIAELISREIKDPRLAGLISVTEVDTTTDLRHAKVFVSVFGTEEERASSLAALRSATGFLRREVAQRVTFRHMPELEFHLDSSIEQGDKIMRLLRQVADEKAAAEPKPATRRRPAPRG